jgi:hypothetical protein
MDGRGFDELSKAIAGGASRRTIIRMLTGGLIGGVATLAGGVGADAVTCRGDGRLCVQSANCCSGTCCPDHRCLCRTSPSPSCFANCGACGHDCSGLQVPGTIGSVTVTQTGTIGCVQGDCVSSAQVCGPACFDGWVADCDGDGVAESLIGDQTNCAFCGNDCTAVGLTCIITLENVFGCGGPFDPQGAGGGFPFG